MITIALDENGDFEGFKGAGNKEPLFIAGIVYDDKGQDVYKRQLKYWLSRCNSPYRLRY